MRVATVVAVLLLGCICPGSPALAETGVSHTLSFDPSQVSIETRDGFDVVRVEGCRFDLDAGKPMVPVRAVHLSVPAGMVASGVEVRSVDRVQIPGKFFLCPSQPPVKLSDTTVPEFIEPDPSVYGSSTPFPAEPVELLPTGDMGGYAVVGLRVFPLEYHPSDGSVYLIRSMDLVLTLAPSGEPAAPIAGRTEQGERVVADRVRALVVNPEAVDDHIGPRAKGDRLATVEYAIVVGSGYEDEFQPLADWKTKKGVPTQIFTTTWIYSAYSGTDNAQRIRNFIIDYEANHGLVYVLLGGDTDVVPARTVWDDLGYDGIRADLYFSDTDGTWNADGDSYWGEYPADNVDMYGDIYVGRAPVNTSSEATNFVNQVLRYEASSAGASLPTDFQQDMLFMGEVLWGPPDYDYTDGGVAKDMIDTNYVPSRFDPITKLYQDDGNLSYSSAMAGMNAGPGITNHCGHANYSVMSIGDDALYNADMDDLTNGARQGIFYTIGCWAAAIDYDAIAEHYVNNPNGGGVAFVGNSRYGWGCPGYPGECVSDLYDQQFFRALFTSDLYHLSAAHADAKDFYVLDAQSDAYMRYGLYEINVLGDPEMPIWTKTPQTLAVSHPASLPTGSSTFTVTVSTAKTAVQGATVCLMKGTEVYAVGVTNTSGQATFEPAPATAGTMSVTVVKHDYLPYEGTATVEEGTPVIFITHTPLSDTEDANGPYPVVATITSTETSLDPDSILVIYEAVAAKAWHSVLMTPTGTPDEYRGSIPGQPCGTIVDYYILAVDENHNRETHPDLAPSNTHEFSVNLTVIFNHDFESAQGWTVGAPDDNASSGIWSRCDPQATTAQPEDDHTAAPGVNAYITDCNAGSNQGSYDVDGGKTTLYSPVFDLSSYSGASVTYYRWYSNDTGSNPSTDYWTVSVTDDNGATWVNLEYTNVSARAWTQKAFDIGAYVDLTDQVRFRFVARDDGGGSIVEAGVDDFSIGGCSEPGDTEPPVVTVIEPNGGESLPGGEPFNIEWTATDNVGVTGTTILLSTNGGATYPTTIASGALTSPYTWDVPDTDEGACRIRVVCVDAASNEGSDASNGSFSILPKDHEAPVVTVVTPNGGEELHGGDPFVVCWSATDNVGVTWSTLLLSTDGGATYGDTLAAGLADTAWVWNVPDVDREACRIRVVCHDAEMNAGADESDADFRIVSTATAVTERLSIPADFVLGQNRPNPFNPVTEIEFGLPASGHARLEVYDVNGRLLSTLADGVFSAGYHRAVWRGTDDAGAEVSSGMYFCRLTAGERTITRKMLMLK
jgi:hypothetical protein